jgi:hypothetical protein
MRQGLPSMREIMCRDGRVRKPHQAACRAVAASSTFPDIGTRRAGERRAFPSGFVVQMDALASADTPEAMIAEYAIQAREEYGHARNATAMVLPCGGLVIS